MIDRRSLLRASAALPVLVAGLTSAAQAYEFHPYEPATVAAAIKSGKPVIVHIYASWCLQCRAQAENFASMQSDPQLDRITFFKVDYDAQKDIVAVLNAPRSTLIGYKDGKEVLRTSWGVSRDDIVKIIQAVY